MKSWASAALAASITRSGDVRLAVGDVVADGVVEEDGLLGDLADLSAERAETHVAKVVAVDEDTAGSHVEEARNEIDHR